MFGGTYCSSESITRCLYTLIFPDKRASLYAAVRLLTTITDCSVHPRFLIREGPYSYRFCSLFGKCVYKAQCYIRDSLTSDEARPEHVPVDVIKSRLQHSFRVGGPTRHFPLHRGFLCEPLVIFRCEENGGVVRFAKARSERAL